jgi:hypothetical protein
VDRQLQVAALIDGKKVEASIKTVGDHLEVNLSQPLVMTAKQKLEIKLT